MATFYHDQDADLKFLKDKKIAIIGYGNQGRAHALNLKDSGLEVMVGTARDQTFSQAQKDGLLVMSPSEAAKAAQVILMLIPDEVMPQVYEESIQPHLKEADALDFASGYNIAFGLIKPHAFVDVVMVAPRMIGEGVRRLFVEGKGFPSFVGVHQDFSGSAKQRMLALAKGIGSTKAGVLEVTMAQEAEIDLFSEQAFGPAFDAALMTCIEVELEAGLPPEAILLELYMSGEMSMVFDVVVEMGLIKQMDLHSHTSQYGSLSRAKRFQFPQLKEKMKEVMEEIRSGAFAKEWSQEQAQGLPLFKKLKAKALQHPLNQWEDTLRKEMGLGK